MVWLFQRGGVRAMTLWTLSHEATCLLGYCLVNSWWLTWSYIQPKFSKCANVWLFLVDVLTLWTLPKKTGWDVFLNVGFPLTWRDGVNQWNRRTSTDWIWVGHVWMGLDFWGPIFFDSYQMGFKTPDQVRKVNAGLACTEEIKFDIISPSRWIESLSKIGIWRWHKLGRCSH